MPTAPLLITLSSVAATFLFFYSRRMIMQKDSIMHFSGAAECATDTNPFNKKQPYIRPKAMVVTDDEAEAWLRGKAAPQSEEFEFCNRLIAEARERQQRVLGSRR